MPLEIDLICVHCAFTYADQDIGLAEIDKWHRDRGFNGCGYNYIIRRDGALELGRLEGLELAHARGFNKNAIAVCLVGGKGEYGQPEANFTAMQTKSLKTFLSFMGLKYPEARMLGHRDLPGVNKDCPCFDLHHFVVTGELIYPEKQS